MSKKNQNKEHQELTTSIYRLSSPPRLYSQKRTNAAVLRCSFGKGTSQDYECITKLVARRVGWKLSKRTGDLGRFLTTESGGGYSQIQIYQHFFKPHTNNIGYSNKPTTEVDVLATIITSSFLRSDRKAICGCWKRYGSYEEIYEDGAIKKKFTNPKSKGSYEVCQSKHRVTALNEPSTDKRKTRTYSPEDFLWNAVDGNQLLYGGLSDKLMSGVCRDFGNSMLGSALELPDGKRLYVESFFMRDEKTGEVKTNEKGKGIKSYRLVAKDSLIENDAQSGGISFVPPTNDGYSISDHNPIWYCEWCREIVGRHGEVCRSQSCYWTPKLLANDPSGRVVICNALHGEASSQEIRLELDNVCTDLLGNFESLNIVSTGETASLFACKKRHFWPGFGRGGAQCPKCDRVPQAKEKVEIHTIRVVDQQTQEDRSDA